MQIDKLRATFYCKQMFSTLQAVSAGIVLLTLGIPLGLMVGKSLRFRGGQQRAQTLIAELEDLIDEFTTKSGYLRKSYIFTLKKSLNELLRSMPSFSSHNLELSEKETLKKAKDLVARIDDLVEHRNQIYLECEKARANDLFLPQDGSPSLNDEQLRAVLVDDDRNLVVAGAGSGKTKVIEVKIKYLVQYKNVSPHRILLLSFSKKSASDLEKKVAKDVPGIKPKTIHSFSYQFSSKKGGKLFDPSKSELESTLYKALAKTLSDEKAKTKLLKFHKNFFSDLKPLIFYDNISTLRRDLHNLNSVFIHEYDRFGELRLRRAIKTLKGELVRSVDEQYIADFLFLNDVNYEYEKLYPFHKYNYRPDFYLPDYDVYLESFAITEYRRPPSWFKDPDKYLRGIEWKRNIHFKHNSNLIECFSYLLNSGNSELYLKSLLKEHGISIRLDAENRKGIQKLSRRFSAFFLQFFNRYKVSGKSLSDLKFKYKNSKEFLFLEVFEVFLYHFQNLAEDMNRMDFSDMILQASSMNNSVFANQYDYIIVDEFQDTSHIAMNLLNRVFEANQNASFFCVGDDWQSIYGFNGSDCSIITDYEKNYKFTSYLALTSNFRSHANIVDLGKKFISKNKNQIPKDTRSKCNKYKKSTIDFINLDGMKKLIESTPNEESIFVLYRYNDDCPGKDPYFSKFLDSCGNGKFRKKENCSRDISFLTIHSSKGLEAQHVFVLFPEDGKKKFPSETEDHFIFNVLKSKQDPDSFAEERRLMYVAITRAKQNLFFVSQNKNGQVNSIFWDELQEIARQSGFHHTLQREI